MLSCVGEADNKLVDHAVLPDTAGQELNFEIRRHLRDENLAIEYSQRLAPGGTGTDWHMDQHWILGHRRDRRVGIFPLELSGGVSLPHIDACSAVVNTGTRPSPS